MRTYTKEEIHEYVEHTILGYGKPKKPDEYYSKEEVHAEIKADSKRANKKFKDLEDKIGGLLLDLAWRNDNEQSTQS